MQVVTIFTECLKRANGAEMLVHAGFSAYRDAVQSPQLVIPKLGVK